MIPLLATGSAFPFQPNLLTDFQHKGLYNIILLARHLDHLTQIPYLEQVDNLSSVERPDFPLSSPYNKIHDEVKALMPLVLSVAPSTDSSMDNDESLSKTITV